MKPCIHQTIISDDTVNCNSAYLVHSGTVPLSFCETCPFINKPNQDKIPERNIQIKKKKSILAASKVPCEHRLDIIETVPCDICGGGKGKPVDVYECEIHTKCTVNRQLERVHITCTTCSDRPNLDKLPQLNLKLPKYNPKKDQPFKVAVVVLSHNYGRFLHEALGSIHTQTRKPDEIILINDASTDNTAAYENYPGVMYSKIDCKNITLARKEGFDKTGSDIICFLDGDDRLSETYIEDGIAAFTDYQVGIVHSDITRFGKIKGSIEFPQIVDTTNIEKTNLIHSTSMVRREALEQADVFAEPYKTNVVLEDWLMWRKVLKLGWYANKQKSNLYYRRHKDQATVSAREHSYYLRKNLCTEPITLFIALSGRDYAWDKQKVFLEEQHKNASEIKLVLLDTSQNEKFSEDVQLWLAKSKYNNYRYIQKSLGNKNLADDNRYIHINRVHVRRVMTQIYNHLKQLPENEYIMVVEDDVIPPLDACDRLLRMFDYNVASASLPYESRFMKGQYVAWKRWPNCLFKSEVKESNVQAVQGNGFGCVMLRASVLRRTVFTSHNGSSDFDPNFYERLEPEWKRLVDFSVECKHLINPDSKDKEVHTVDKHIKIHTKPLVVIQSP